MASPSLPPLAILGGAGPRVAAQFQLALLEAFQAQTGAWRDSQFPALITLTHAWDGMDETGVARPDQVQTSLTHLLTQAQSVGAQAVVVACASAHVALPSAPSVPVLDWLDGAARLAQARGWQRVAVLGARSARGTDVLLAPLLARGLTPVGVDVFTQGLIDQLIVDLMAGRDGPALAQAVARIEAQVPACDGLWWACTELSLFPDAWTRRPALRSLEAMVATSLAFFATPTEICHEDSCFIPRPAVA